MNAKTPDWGDLAVFLATARGGTLGAAGEALAIDASTVQRRIGKLESRLETRLFERSQRGYALTVAGQDLLEHTLTIEREVLAIGRRIGARDRTLEGTVRVTTVDDLAVAVLSPIVRDFRRAHPRVTIEVGIGQAFADLMRRQADVALRFGRKPTGPDLIVKHLSRADVALYGSRNYLRRHGRPASLDALREHAIVRGDEAMAAVPMERRMRELAEPAKVALESNSMLARVIAVRDGIGLGLIPCFMGERERTLERIDLPWPDLSSNLWMVIHADLRRNARVRAFVDFAHAAIVAQQSRFEHPG